jgi:receptor protein-tyrosine kinase
METIDVKRVSLASESAGLAGLFDLRDTGRIPARSGDERPLTELADTRLVVNPEANAVFVEQYRRLAAALHQAQIQQGIRTVMVTSALEAEGKTLSATNVALTLSHSFRKRVLLVDGDLRKPSVHQLLQLQNGVGLSDTLRRPDGRLPMQEVHPTLSVITGGHHDPDPVAVLVSDALQQFLNDTRDQFDWIVVDTPPIILFPDAGLFADKLDTCLLVLSAATTASPVAARAVAAIGASRILGVVLNRAESSEVAGGYGYGHYGYPGTRGPNSTFTW